MRNYYKSIAPSSSSLTCVPLSSDLHGSGSPLTSGSRSSRSQASNNQLKGFNFNYIEGDTSLYCFFSKNNDGTSNSANNSINDSINDSTNANKSSRDNITIRDNIAVRNSNKSSALEYQQTIKIANDEQPKKPRCTIVTTIDLFANDDLLTTIGRKPAAQCKTNFNVFTRLNAALSRLYR